MLRTSTYIPVLILLLACQQHHNPPGLKFSNHTALVKGVQTNIPQKSLVNLPSNYEDLEYDSLETISASSGTKSVVFAPSGNKLYAMNLEGMSIYEFDRKTRKILREFKFKPNKGTGWNYDLHKPIPSYQEKPVEACFSHHDRILWISLHNAEGIVPLRLDSLGSGKNSQPGQAQKILSVHYPGSKKVDTIRVPLIKTGKTPKVISRTMDSKYLFVSNWHSYNVSVLELNPNQYPYGKVISTVPVSAIPRGMAVDDMKQKTYVAIMGGATIEVINNLSWTKDTILNVESNPRHILLDNKGRLFVSYNSLGSIACLDATTGKTLFSAKTHAQPRTIALSKNQKFIFVTCYSGNMVDVYKITDNSFVKVASLPCAGKPVGVDIFEDESRLEAWVCSYSTGSINIYSFNKK